MASDVCLPDRYDFFLLYILCVRLLICMDFSISPKGQDLFLRLIYVVGAGTGVAAVLDEDPEWKREVGSVGWAVVVPGGFAFALSVGVLLVALVAVRTREFQL